MKKKKSFNRDIEFLYEIGSIRFIDRTWKQILPHVQNLAEHHFRVAWIALVLAKMEGKGDTATILKMALVHDIAESRTGDVNYLQRQYVIRNEEQGITDMLAESVLQEEFLTLWKAYEKRESIEAQIVKDADNLDVDFEIREAKWRGNMVIDDWQKIRKHVAENKFYTKSAKKIWKLLQTSNPHDWHINGRNRFNSGDWKKFKK
jgi:putative hydrolases of HD superfamily